MLRRDEPQPVGGHVQHSHAGKPAALCAVLLGTNNPGCASNSCGLVLPQTGFVAVAVVMGMSHCRLWHHRALLLRSVPPAQTFAHSRARSCRLAARTLTPAISKPHCSLYSTLTRTSTAMPRHRPSCVDHHQFMQATPSLELPHAFGAMPPPIFERDPAVDARINAARVAAAEAAATAPGATGEKPNHPGASGSSGGPGAGAAVTSSAASEEATATSDQGASTAAGGEADQVAGAVGVGDDTALGTAHASRTVAAADVGTSTVEDAAAAAVPMKLVSSGGSPHTRPVSDGGDSDSVPAAAKVTSSSLYGTSVVSTASGLTAGGSQPADGSIGADAASASASLPDDIAVDTLTLHPAVRDEEAGIGSMSVGQTAPARQAAVVNAPGLQHVRARDALVNPPLAAQTASGAAEAGTESPGAAEPEVADVTEVPAGLAALPRADSDHVASVEADGSNAQAEGATRRGAELDSDDVEQPSADAESRRVAAVIDPRAADVAAKSSAAGESAAKQKAVVEVDREPKMEPYPDADADGGSAVAGGGDDSKHVQGDSVASIATGDGESAAGDASVAGSGSVSPDDARDSVMRPSIDGSGGTDQPIVLGAVSIGDAEGEGPPEGFAEAVDAALASRQRFQQERRLERSSTEEEKS